MITYSRLSDLAQAQAAKLLEHYGPEPDRMRSWPAYKEQYGWLHTGWAPRTLRSTTAMAKALTDEQLARLGGDPEDVRLIYALRADRVLDNDTQHPKEYWDWFAQQHAEWYAKIDSEIYHFAFGVFLPLEALAEWTALLDAISLSHNLEERVRQALGLAYVRRFMYMGAPPFEELHGYDDAE